MLIHLHNEISIDNYDEMVMIKTDDCFVLCFKSQPNHNDIIIKHIQ